MTSLTQAKKNMIEQQIRPWEVLDANILNLFASIPRESFVDENYKSIAYSDIAIPLTNGSSMWCPREEARILQSLQITAHDNVLEIGVGSGYMTACLASLANRVDGYDIDSTCITQATERLQQHSITNTTLTVGDGFVIECNQQYDIIVVGTPIKKITKQLFQALKIGGRLLIMKQEQYFNATMMTKLSENNNILPENNCKSEVLFIFAHQPSSNELDQFSF